MVAIDRIINTIAQRVCGSSCVPETSEAAYVTEMWDAARRLDAPLREELLRRTGVNQDSVKQIREEAADALYEAHRALYGNPWELP